MISEFKRKRSRSISAENQIWVAVFFLGCETSSATKATAIPSDTSRKRCQAKTQAGPREISTTMLKVMAATRYALHDRDTAARIPQTKIPIA
jgi:hypothetical protein